jgi:hypothetical protein
MPVRTCRRTSRRRRSTRADATAAPVQSSCPRRTSRQMRCPRPPPPWQQRERRRRRRRRRRRGPTRWGWTGAVLSAWTRTGTAPCSTCASVRRKGAGRPVVAAADAGRGRGEGRCRRLLLRVHSGMGAPGAAVPAVQAGVSLHGPRHSVRDRLCAGTTGDARRSPGCGAAHPPWRTVRATPTSPALGRRHACSSSNNSSSSRTRPPPSRRVREGARTRAALMGLTVPA